MADCLRRADTLSLPQNGGGEPRAILETMMADNNHAPAHGADGMDYAEHEKTYARFTSLVKYGSVAVVVLLILMAVFLR